MSQRDVVFTPLMLRVRDVLDGADRSAPLRLRVSPMQPIADATDEWFYLRARSEQVIAEANAMIGDRTAPVDLDDEYGTGQLGFVLRRGGRSVRICMGQTGRQAWVELQRPSVADEASGRTGGPGRARGPRRRAPRGPGGGGAAMSAVMAVLDFHGDSDELAARYDKAVHEVVAVSSARPLLHLAVPREYGFMVVDVWSSEEVLRAFDENDEFRRVLREAGLPESKLRVYPVHNLGWPVEAMPLYR